jgi:hypothetical protein
MIYTLQNDTNFRDFFNGYIQAALFCNTDENGDPNMDGYSITDLDEFTHDVMCADCLSFFNRAKGYITAEAEPPTKMWEQAGYDFFLTSHRHGAGFWDGDWPEHGDTLTKLAHLYPEETLLELDSDTGKIYRC